MELTNWQTWVALACVAWAVVMIVRRASRLVRSGGEGACGSGGCGSCPSESESASTGLRERPLVTLDSPPASHEDRQRR